MDIAKSLSPARAFKAFGFAADGLRYAFFNEPSFVRIAVIEAVIAVVLGWYLWPLSAHEVALLLMAGILVPITEILNTSIEILVDMVHPGQDVRVKRIKDCAAGATLMSSIVAVLVALLVVWAH